MLSNVDIENEIGKGIIIYPFRKHNIRGNSLNLSASSLAWSLRGGRISNSACANYTIPDGSVKSGDEICIPALNSIVFEKASGKKVLIIPANDTALIETEEAISVNSRIGGTYHSKVGVVSQGIGHIGTTLDPLYTGQSLIAIHNHSHKEVEIEVGSTFVSVIFNYLNSKSTYQNTNYHGHVGLLAKLGIQLSVDESSILEEEWKKSRKLLLEKLTESEVYKEHTEKLKKMKNRDKYLTMTFFKTVCLPVLITLGVMLAIPLAYDLYNKDTTFTTLKWVGNVSLSGLFVLIIGTILTYKLNKFEREVE